MEYLQKDFEFASKVGHKIGISCSAGNMGRVYFNLGDYKKAAEYYKIDLEISEELGNRIGLSHVMNNLGNLSKKQGVYDKAEEYYNKAIDIGKRLQVRYYLCEYLYNKADLYFLQGRYSHAEACNYEAKSVAVSVSRKDMVFLTNVLSAKILFEKNSENNKTTEEAIRHLNVMLVKSEDDKERAILNYELYKMIGEEKYCEQALKLYQKLNNEMPTLEYTEKISELKLEVKILTQEKTEKIEKAQDSIINKQDELYMAKTMDLGNTISKQGTKDLLYFINLISSNLCKKELLESIIDVVIKLTQAERGFLMLRNEEGKLDVAVGRNINKVTIKEEDFEFSRSIIKKVEETKTPIVIRDTTEEMELDSDSSILQLKLLSLMCVPLIRKGTADLIGVIYVDSKIANKTFNKEDMALLEAISNQAAISIENALLYEKAERDRTDLERIYEVAQAISSVLNLDELLTLIVDTVLDITKAERGFLMLLNPNGKKRNTRDLEFRIARNHHRETLTEDDFVISFSIPMRVVETGEPVLLSDIEDERQFTPTTSMLNLQLKSVLCIPLKTGNKILGVIYVDNSIAKGNFGERELNLLKTLSSETAIAIENAMLYKDLQKAHRDILKLDEMKSKFVNLASHELRTPLTVITGYLFLLNNPERLKNTKVNVIETIKKNVDKLVAIVSNISDLSRLTKPRYKLKKELVSINKLINDIKTEIEPFILERGQTLTLNLPEKELFAEINVDSIWQTIVNLLLNAIRFTPDGGSITIEAYSRFSDFEIRVIDTGIGIPKSEYENIFKSFYEINEISHHSSGEIAFKAGGLGVGLTIAKGAVELHGGHIWVESEVGKGSTFIFVIPKKAKQL